ncbi:ABC transporter ATP-binding protein [Actinomyces sp. 2119]|uniref:ABC transporter ATP-binding protein n=1 Tax=Actinomyces lilanjuaniae TaxID=2321394 RepID=A0ABN5PRZ7_9ACTO|nr:MULTISPECIES: ABC transporter ATP-binding protein [Actinomyces]AYD89540.1 ABC transporter ATP-binding protein [Actinomyces lilanjuaniae]RJF43102.1 ABC transporter ATP-binding protein [Actinomyces sp. 2119]
MSISQPGTHSPAPTVPRPARTPAVEATGLRKSFGRLTAVSGLDLTVTPGEVVAFLGPNGAGKSTTLDMILGLSSPDEGRARVLGRSPAAAVRDGAVGAVLQDGGLLGDLTVAETLRAVASMGSGRVDLDDLAALTGLSEVLRRRVSRCSGGERQRLRLALALMPDPEVLVMDEPTAGMDVAARITFWETMRSQTRRGRTVLFATHYLEEASSFADRVVIIAQGRVVADGSVDDVRGLGTGATVTASWPGASEHVLSTALAWCPVSSTVLRTVVRGTHVEIRTTDPDGLARWLLTDTPARNLGVTATSLDEVFTSLTSSGTSPAPSAAKDS